jgi:hypothetical protein
VLSASVRLPQAVRGQMKRDLDAARHTLESWQGLRTPQHRLSYLQIQSAPKRRPIAGSSSGRSVWHIGAAFQIIGRNPEYDPRWDAVHWEEAHPEEAAANLAQWRVHEHLNYWLDQEMTCTIQQDLALIRKPSPSAEEEPVLFWDENEGCWMDRYRSGAVRCHGHLLADGGGSFAREDPGYAKEVEEEVVRSEAGRDEERKERSGGEGRGLKAWEEGRVVNDGMKDVVAVRETAVVPTVAARTPASIATTVAVVTSGAVVSGSQKRVLSDMRARYFQLFAHWFRREALPCEAGGTRSVRSRRTSGTSVGIRDGPRRGSSRRRSHSTGRRGLVREPKDCVLFLENLPVQDCIEAQVRAWLTGFGTVEALFLLTSEQGSPLGKAYVRFTKHRAALACLEAHSMPGEGDVLATWSALGSMTWRQQLHFMYTVGQRGSGASDNSGSRGGGFRSPFAPTRG